MIDIHTHILPGIDDGPQTIEESIEIAKRASDEGVKAIVATPHVLEAISEDGWKRIRVVFDQLKQRLISAKIDIDIILGAELFISPDVPAWIKRNRELTIDSGNKYILIELPLYEIPPFTEQTIFELLLQGIVPIIAHPERCMAIQQDTNRLSALVEKGVLTQANVGSLTGKYGKASRKTAKTLLTLNLIHMLSTDVHSVSNGSTLSQGMEIAAEVVGIERAKEMVTSIPEKMIRGEEIRAFLSVFPKSKQNRSKHGNIISIALSKMTIDWNII